MTQSYFENIDLYLMSALMSAQNSIRAAVAWCTDPQILRVLATALQRGVAVELIVNDDKINKKTDMSLLTSKGGKVFYADTTTNIMHCKFCIIDGICVVSGSYNWTKHAQSNDEQITVTTEEPAEINKFQDMFDNLMRAIEDKHRLLAEEAEKFITTKKVGRSDYIKEFDRIVRNINVIDKSVYRPHHVFKISSENDKKIADAAIALNTSRSNVVNGAVELFCYILRTQCPELYEQYKHINEQ